MFNIKFLLGFLLYGLSNYDISFYFIGLQNQGNLFSQSSKRHEDGESKRMKDEGSIDTDSFDMNQQDEMFTILQSTDENLDDKDAFIEDETNPMAEETRNLYNLHKRFMFLVSIRFTRSS